MSTTEQTKQIARDYHQKIWVEKDVAALKNFIHDDFVDDSRQDFSQTGPEYAGAFFASLFASFPDLTAYDLDMFAENDQVALRWRLTGTYNGQSFWNMPVTGKTFDIEGTDILKLKDGKICREWGGLAIQIPNIFKQLGLSQ